MGLKEKLVSNDELEGLTEVVFAVVRLGGCEHLHHHALVGSLLVKGHVHLLGLLVKLASVTELL